MGHEFFSVDARTLARGLIGKVLLRRLEGGGVAAGRIVETEAYLGVRDRAAHVFGGRRTARNESMYGPPGTAYVYFTYGMHHCFNIVCGEEGEPTAALVRALEPLAGLGRMRALRMTGRGGTGEIADRDLCRGPGRLCRAMSIDLSLNGIDLTRDGRLWVCEGAEMGKPGKMRIVRTARIGVDYADAWAKRPLRFLIDGHPCVSAPLRSTKSPGTRSRRNG
ncbi:MAG: DNA-3-methyladenine glycosylase [Phycisphaerales bacterium]|nr:DNA-3-methyladenine glycosylase [Phycisphaerales bacterium]